VPVFKVNGHPKAHKAYAWSSPIEGSDKRRFFAVLHLPPVTSPVCERLSWRNTEENREKNMARFLKFGPEQPNPAIRSSWIALVDKDANLQIGGDFLIGKQCQFLSEIEEEVEQIRSDLDEILRDARKRLVP
jgi:hypothetical protein